MFSIYCDFVYSGMKKGFPLLSSCELSKKVGIGGLDR